MMGRQGLAAQGTEPDFDLVELGGLLGQLPLPGIPAARRRAGRAAGVVLEARPGAHMLYGPICTLPDRSNSPSIYMSTLYSPVAKPALY